METVRRRVAPKTNTVHESLPYSDFTTLLYKCLICTSNVGVVVALKSNLVFSVTLVLVTPYFSLLVSASKVPCLSGSTLGSTHTGQWFIPPKNLWLVSPKLLLFVL